MKYNLKSFNTGLKIDSIKFKPMHLKGLGESWYKAGDIAEFLYEKGYESGHITEFLFSKGISEIEASFLSTLSKPTFPEIKLTSFKSPITLENPFKELQSKPIFAPEIDILKNL